MAIQNPLTDPNRPRNPFKKGFGDDLRKRQSEFGALTTPGPDLFKRVFRDTREELNPVIEGALMPGLTSAASRVANTRGDTLPGGIDIARAAGTNFANARSFDVASELTGLRGVSRDIMAGMPPGVSRGDVNRMAIGGAAQGFAAGGPVGAAVGLFTGALAGRSARKKARKAQAAVHAKAGQVSDLAQAKTVREDIEKSGSISREASLASGAGARRQQVIESAISSSGLRGTGLGSLASIAAGVQPEIGAIDLQLEKAVDSTFEQVSTAAGAPIPRQKGDNLAESITALAEGFLAFKSGGSGKSATPSGSPIGTQVGSRIIA